jgi:hypothetical protein
MLRVAAVLALGVSVAPDIDSVLGIPLLYRDSKVLKAGQPVPFYASMPRCHLGCGTFYLMITISAV